MKNFDEAVVSWADTINDWYSLKATPEEVAEAFRNEYKHKRTYDDFGEPDGASYVDVFFRDRDGAWTLWLDTADREGLADAVERLRGNPPLPTYSDLGGTLLNKAPRR